MEASGSGTNMPPETTAPTPPPPPPGAPAEPKASGGWRAIAGIAVIVLILAGLFMGGFSYAVMDAPSCDDQAAVLREIQEKGVDDATCWHTPALRVISGGIGWISTALLGLGVLLSLVVAVTGTRGRLLVWTVILAVIAGGLSVLVAAID